MNMNSNIDEAKYILHKALDESRDNIRKATDEARRKIPGYTQAVNEYQEQTIQAAREITDNYLESQKQIINSLQSAWLPQIEAANGVLTSWISPRHLTDSYARIVSNIADNTVTTTRLLNNTLFTNLESFEKSIQSIRDNAREFSRICVNSAKILEHVSKDNTSAIGAATSEQERKYEEGAAGTEIGRNDDPLTEYRKNEPMTPAKIKEHEPTAVKREMTEKITEQGKPNPEAARERARRSGMAKGTAGAAGTGNEYEQGAAGTNK